ncbi:glycosyltransferase [Mycolicibacterium novocastrense]|uniref:glycosyltransferase family 2 protein n=1 Tax=Mycolicibacterium novocastrense TaxID=59813 RepID=UPI00074AB401|nr:glycosyltransferase family 2 protein [Mycolicibacterium novocastrense]KUH75768.1 glycosyltransferase [Mycolicibacterium novocastrense]KUH78329.1 glycosyltransferase [Mycolicibacterium novocastrense]KUH79664.1 glycosyltransferase [Mycolicibacterium novocastrense]
MADPMFSIIIPTFNAAETLQTCLDSVVRQTWDSFEVILVDGRSTDGTLDVARGFTSELGTRLVVHSGSDDGPYDAMNRGVSMATGSWLLFLGADDTLHADDTLAQVVAFIESQDHSDLVYGDAIMRSTGVRHAGAFDLDRLLFETNICHQSIFYRRAIFDGIGPYNLRYRVWADWDYNIRCFSNPALAIRYMDLVVANYNDMTGLSMRERVDKEFRKRLPMYFWVAAWETCSRMLSFLRRPENRRLAVRSRVIRYKAVSGRSTSADESSPTRTL